MSSLVNITPIDGRYKSKVKELESFFSEYAFFKYRIFVEIKYLLFLSEQGIISEILSEDKIKINNIYENFDLNECEKIKDIEGKTNHDVKAIEYYIKDKICESVTLTDNIRNMVHFALTSQDVNSSANILMIKDSIGNVVLPLLNGLSNEFKNISEKWMVIPLLSKTHGQTATPTTFGKEFKVYYERLDNQLNILRHQSYRTKFGGAVGNLNAHYFANNQIDWVNFSNEFIKSLKLTRHQYTTQIDHYDNYGEIFDVLKRINVILIDFCQDIWLYISRNVLIQKIKKNEVGSSTMPFKVNPINFENAEGNFLLANTLLEFFSRKLPISRLQRDLTDSTVLRNIGVAFSYMIIALKSLYTGIGKIDLNLDQIDKELQDNFLVITEGIQTKLKLLGFSNSYEDMKELSRNYSSNAEMKKKINNYIRFLNVSEEVKNELLELSPFNYLGFLNKYCI